MDAVNGSTCDATRSFFSCQAVSQPKQDIVNSAFGLEQIVEYLANSGHFQDMLI